ncbi:MAG: hypothetical protein LC647_06965 [Beggiatoa sp.]|nr:hypothetical protein [Beggiatoa sp.]
MAISATNSASATAIRQSTVMNTIIAPIKSVTGGAIFQLRVEVMSEHRHFKRTFSSRDTVLLGS